MDIVDGHMGLMALGQGFRDGGNIKAFLGCSFVLERPTTLAFKGIPLFPIESIFINYIFGFIGGKRS